MSEAVAPVAGMPAPAPARAARDLPDPLPVPSAQEIKKEASPFNDPDWRVRLYTWCGFGLRVLLIIGAVVTALEYFAAREEKRVEHTLDLVTLWEGERYQEAQAALDARLQPLRENAVAMLGSDPARADLELLYKRIGEQAMTEAGGSQPLPEFRDAFGRIVYFLNRLAFCVEGNLCSRDVADAYFRDFAESFWIYFSGYILDERKTSPNYAKPLEDYVKSTGGRGLLWFLPAAPATPSGPGGTN